jgi:MFS family permease
LKRDHSGGTLKHGKRYLSCSSALFLGVPLSIWLAGHVGYKRFIIATILLFATASAGCALAIVGQRYMT